MRTYLTKIAVSDALVEFVTLLATAHLGIVHMALSIIGDKATMVTRTLPNTPTASRALMFSSCMYCL